MIHDQEQPVIIGSGLSGMMISEMLSRDRIHHVLIGDAPNTLPRLGESLNLDGTLGLWELFPEFSQYYIPKKYAVSYLGDYVFVCTFARGRLILPRLFFTLLGYKTPLNGLVQFDRLGFDAALYNQVISSPYCQQMSEKVVDIAYDPPSDTLKKITFSNGDFLTPSYVFDATNHGRLVGQAAGIHCTMIGDPQRVVYTHYHAQEDAAAPLEAWEYSTNIILLSPERDTIHGLAWCIPLGNYVSIGVNIKASDSNLSDEALLEIAEQAYARRGLHYRQRYRLPTTTMSLKYHFFIHERAYGGNWLLVGPAYCQIWWMSGAGVGTSFAAAQIAASVLQNPQKFGRLYQDYLRGLLNLHRIFDWFISTDYSLVTVKDVAGQGDHLVTSNLRRIARSTRLRPRKISQLFGFLFSRILTLKGYCYAIKVEPAQQTESIFKRAVEKR
ncbi:MAG TPA: hypothetical protein VKR06_01105 [Ktedonosporobacter sp.]|nr:hypothetical protein [Ktedonosporobacter sp.]